MYDEGEVFEALSETARGPRELNLVEKFVRGEKLRHWLINTKEGQAISEKLEYMYCRALDDFENAPTGAFNQLEAAKIDLTVAKRIYEVFNGIFQDADIAEKTLAGEIEDGS